MEGQRVQYRSKIIISILFLFFSIFLFRFVLTSQFYRVLENTFQKRWKSRECHNHKPQPFPDPKRKRKPTNLNKHKPNKRKKSTKISSLFPKRGNRNTKRTEKHKNKMTHGKTYNKSPRRINYKAIKSKTNTGTTALERSVKQTTGGLKHFYSQPTSPWVPMLLLTQKYIKIRFAQRLPTQSMHQSENIKIKLITIINKDEYSWLKPNVQWLRWRALLRL